MPISLTSKRQSRWSCAFQSLESEAAFSHLQPTPSCRGRLFFSRVLVFPCSLVLFRRELAAVRLRRRRGSGLSLGLFCFFSYCTGGTIPCLRRSGMGRPRANGCWRFA